MKTFHKGQRLTYNDGRPGHTDAKATVLRVGKSAIVVQFDDRADTTAIRFTDKTWVDYLKPCEH